MFATSTPPAPTAEPKEFLGQWLRLRLIEPGAVTISSKWGYTYTADWQVRRRSARGQGPSSADTLRRQLAETREQLGEHLTLYQIHSATASGGVLEDPEARTLLAELRSRGVAVGFSATGTEQPNTIRRAIEVGGFDTVQATYNLLERSAGDALEAAHDAGMGVIIKEALANGRLTARGGIGPLTDAARRLGTTEDAVALAGVLARPWVDAALSGAATVDQLHSNLGAVAIEWSDELEAQLSGLVETPDRYWATRSQLTWT